MSVWLQLVVSNILVAGLIALLAWQVGRSGRQATLAHILWLAFFIKLITPPIVLMPINVPENWFPAARAYTSTFPYLGSTSQPHSSASFLPATQSVSLARAANTSVSRGSMFTQNFHLWTCLSCVWFFGFSIILIRGMIRFVRFHRLLVREGKHDQEASCFVQQLLNANQVKTSRASSFSPSVAGPKVLRLPMRVSPMLFGFGGRPVIVCPDQLWHSLSEQERHAFLAHETAHYCRRDHLVRWLEWFVTAAYWWFPGVYIARRQLERHEEACCDAWAVRQLDSTPRHYAEALLRVVDFISEHHVSIPRLASGMQPTDSLEERLRLVMTKGNDDDPSSPLAWCASVACFSLWILHPLPTPYSDPVVAIVNNWPQPDSLAAIDSPALTQSPPLPEIELPEPPAGFWNRAAEQKWAEFALLIPGARLIAKADQGITVETPGHDTLQFSPEQLTAIVEIPATGRIVIGDQQGKLRLWDLNAGMPVSLIGQHQSAITSLAFHPSEGLISADESGSVMRWDLQSGQILATWSSSSGPVQSIRYSSEGELIAILTGRWNENPNVQKLHFVDSASLKDLSTIMVAANTAVVFHSPDVGWVAANWSGDIRLLETNAVIASVPKQRVSALMLSQQTYQRRMNLSVSVP
jgi:beta-lactamase regulating signal transducer with metallopeptidase domain